MRTLRTEEDAEAWSKDLRSYEDSGAGHRIRQMSDVDLGRVRELRSVVRWAADPRAFDLLRGIREARWALAEARDGSLSGMVGAVPLGEIGILCHLAVRQDRRKQGLGVMLARWAVCYLRSRGARLIRLDSTRQAESLYLASGFVPTARRIVYRLEGALHSGKRESNSAGGYQISTLAFGDLPELYGVDYWSYGADRSALIFAILRQHPGLGLVARDAYGHMKGCLIRSEANHINRLGPFLAADQEAARLLLARALATNGTTPVEISVPDDGPAHDLLRDFGFTGRADRLRMELGEAPGEHRMGLTQYATTPYLAT